MLTSSFIILQELIYDCKHQGRLTPVLLAKIFSLGLLILQINIIGAVAEYCMKL